MGVCGLRKVYILHPEAYFPCWHRRVWTKHPGSKASMHSTHTIPQIAIYLSPAFLENRITQHMTCFLSTETPFEATEAAQGSLNLTTHKGIYHTAHTPSSKPFATSPVPGPILQIKQAFLSFQTSNMELLLFGWVLHPMFCTCNFMLSHQFCWPLWWLE